MDPFPEMSAFKEQDGLNWSEDKIIKVNDHGEQVNRIDPIAYENDTRAYWKMHEKKLWIVATLCALYLITAIL